MNEFMIALIGRERELDDWLECHSEKEIRDLVIPIVQQRDELLSALKEIVKVSDGPAYGIARREIEKAEKP